MAAQQLSKRPSVHVQPSLDLDPHHDIALNTLLKDCTDDQILAEIARRGIDVQREVSEAMVKEKYKFERILGHGASGSVHLVKHKKSGIRYACKTIKKDGGMNDADSMSTEIEIMKIVRHKNIVGMFELYESSSCMWLILELVEGGCLNFFISEMDHYSENIVSCLFKQALAGVHYLHSQGIVHRDLKLDNILLHGKAADGDVKIADFGLSAIVKVGSQGYDRNESAKRKGFRELHEMWGTASYFAPELIGGAYGPQADVWSLGCILYEMLSGHHPFQGKDDDELFSKIRSGFVDVLSPPWDEISDQAKDLMRKLLIIDPTQRLSCSEALKHPWITGEGLDESHHTHIGIAHGRLTTTHKTNEAVRSSSMCEEDGAHGRSSPWSFSGGSNPKKKTTPSIFSFLAHPHFRSPFGSSSATTESEES